MATTSRPRNTRAAAEYGEASIRVLKGLEPVRSRPGMYTRTDSPLHIVQEVVDNAADEILAGFGRHIDVTVHADGGVTVQDDGRGIPTGMHPEENAPVVEIVFTRLHAGGKFDKRAGGAYSFAGGLHGVGVSVTNALARRLDVTVWRDGKAHSMSFAGGEARQPLAARPPKSGEPRTGTRVTVWPDPKYFDTATIPLDELERLLRSKAVLLPGTTVTMAIEQTGRSEKWRYDGGLQQYLLGALGADPVAPPFEAEGYAGEDDEAFAEGEGARWVLAWTEEGPLTRESYVNLIPTPAGGTHEAGLREGMFHAVRAFVDAHNLLPKGVKLLSEDVFARASFVLAAKVLDPQFQGQIKERLNSRDALRLVAGQVKPQLEIWLNQHPEHGRALADMAIRQAQARARAAQKVEKKKGSAVAVLPGKLTDCESTDVARNELFLVEGDSAGGSAKMGRDKEFQAILPLRGKVLNVEKARLAKLLDNTEIKAMITAIGTGIRDEFALDRLRYHRLIIMADADVDGAHICTLILTFFYRYLPKLIQQGHIYIAKPPLYQVKLGKATHYMHSDAELDAFRKANAGNYSVKRFKGLGEMNPSELWETTMDPEKRILKKVEIRDELEADDIFSTLMGDDVALRRDFIMENSDKITALDI